MDTPAAVTRPDQLTAGGPAAAGRLRAVPTPPPDPEPTSEPDPRYDAPTRVERLADPGSFFELGSGARHASTAFGMAERRPAGDGVLTGHAQVDGRPVALFSQDTSVLGGSLGETHARKILATMRQAGRARTPVVGLLDSGGARIQEGVGALDGYGGIFRENVLQSGRIPQISVVLGSCAGGAVYSPALTDVVILHRGRGQMYLTGPKVVKAVTFEDVTGPELGGAAVHGRSSGVAHLEAEDEDDALDLARRVLSYLPSSCWEAPPVVAARPPAPCADPAMGVPDDPRRTYDVRGVVTGVVDADSFLELSPRFARNIVTGFARVAGAPVGVIANQPQAKGGVLDITSAEKGARFVRMCDAFGLPLVTLVDTPGFLPGTGQESHGVIRKGAKLLYAFAEATVPRVTVVLRKAFGGAYIVMNSKSLGADAVFSWPQAELAVMGADGAIELVFRRELAAEPDRRDELRERYRQEAMAPHIAAERMSVDEIIAPGDTRAAIETVLAGLRGATHPTFRHDNLPQ